MAGYNKWTVLGNVGRDPEMRFTPNGVPVTNFSVAVSSGYGENQKTEWVNVVTWQKLAETCNQYVEKGQQILVEGRSETKIWEDDKGKHYKTELIAYTVVFLGQRRERSQGEDIDEDDLPF